LLIPYLKKSLMTLKDEIGKPDYKNTINVRDAINPDIIKVLEANFPEAKLQAAPIAYRFKGADRLATASNIFSALKNDITYQKDGFGNQDIRLPRRFWHTGTGDCKSFSLNTLAIWSNLYPDDIVRFKYASYNDSPTPTHVYPIVQEPGGKPIIIDGCWIFFNSEKTPTFSHQSKNMNVRTLSGIGEIGDVMDSVFTPRHKAYYEQIYAKLNAPNRERFKEVLRDKLFFEMQKHAAALGEITMGELNDHICFLEGIGRVRKGKGKLGRKILHWFNAAALFLGRAAYLLFVTLNINGLASKLQKLIDWGKFKKLEDTWYILGGNVTKFKQIIARSSRRKKLWLSHKAHVRYNQKFEGKRDAKGNPIEGCEVGYGVHGEIGAAPVAAAAAAAIPVIAALIPKIIDAFKQVPQGKGQADANEMAAQGQDVVQDVKQQGYKPDAESIEMMLPPGQRADLTAPMPEAARDQEGSADMDLDTGGMNGIGDAADVMAALTPALGSLATVGLSELGKVVSRSRNPVVRNIGEIGDAASASYAATRAGYRNDAQYLQRVHREKPGFKLTPPMMIVGAGAIYLLTRNSNQQPTQQIHGFAKDHPVLAAGLVTAAIATVII
jgi:hypothetical protein